MRLLCLLLGFVLGACATPGGARPDDQATRDASALNDPLGRFIRAVARPGVHVQTDRAIYRPGDIIWGRVWTTEALDGRAPEGSLWVHLVDRRGAQVARATLDAIGGFTIPLHPRRIAGGSYKVVAMTNHGTFEREIALTDARTAALIHAFDFDRPAYRPGDAVGAALTVRRPDGTPLEGREVEFELRAGGAVVAKASAITTDGGEATVSIALPAGVGSDAIVSMRVLGDVPEAFVRAVPVAPSEAIHFELYPEGGACVVGLPCRLYFRATDDAGRPQTVAGALRDAAGAVLARFASAHDGLGRVALDAAPSGPVTAVLDGVAGNHGLVEARPAGCTLSADAHEALVRCSVDREVLVVASFRADVALRQWVKVRPGGPSRVALPLADRRRGIMRVTALGTCLAVGDDCTDDTRVPLAERMVFRHLGEALTITMKPRQDAYAPGDVVDVDILTTDANGAPISTNVAISGVDEAVIALAHDDHSHIASSLLLQGDVTADIHRADWYFGDAPLTDRDAALDLVMGTHGYRRFDWSAWPPFRDPSLLLRCPIEMEDLDGWQDEDGCPDPDNDADNILDIDDACPDDPMNRCLISLNQGPDHFDDGLRGAVMPLSGRDPVPATPRALPAQGTHAVVQAQEIRIVSNIYFEPRQTRVEKRSVPLIDELAATLLDHPHLKVIEVGGGTRTAWSRARRSGRASARCGRKRSERC